MLLNFNYSFEVLVKLFMVFHIWQLCEIYLSQLSKFIYWWSYCMWFCWLYYDNLFTYRITVDVIKFQFWSSNSSWQCSQSNSSQEISRFSFKLLDLLIFILRLFFFLNFLAAFLSFFNKMALACSASSLSLAIASSGSFLIINNMTFASSAECLAFSA